MKKRVLLIAGLCLLMTAPTVFADEGVSIETEVTSSAANKDDYSSQLVEKIKLQRQTIYNALNLTPCQLKQTEQIEARRYAAIEPELSKFCILRKKVKTLSCEKNCDKKAINAAEKDLNQVKKNIKNISNKYDKEFKRILTSDQKAKYNMIRKLKRADLKKAEQLCKRGEKPSDLRPFGQPISQAAYTEEVKKQNSFWYRIKNRNKVKSN